MIEESFGIDRKGIKLIIKVIPIIQHHIYTIFRISTNYYRGPADPYTGTGQGNITSGDIYRDKSCFVIKDVDKKGYGANIKSPFQTK